MVRVGVLAVQGAASEHVEALERAAARSGIPLEAVLVRGPEDLDGVDGLIIPGGESTTISRLLGGLRSLVKQRAEAGDLAVFGTCAGMVLLARASRDVLEKGVQQLGLIDAEVDRNAFGRQRDSFEATLDVEGFGKMPCVFIRAPALHDVRDVEVLATFQQRIVAVRRGRILATSFHPELTPDVRLHEMFLEMAQSASLGASVRRR